MDSARERALAEVRAISKCGHPTDGITAYIKEMQAALETAAFRLEFASSIVYSRNTRQFRDYAKEARATYNSLTGKE